MRKVLSSRDLTAALLEGAKRDMELFVKRYEGLRELSGVFTAIDSALGRAKPKKPRNSREARP